DGAGPAGRSGDPSAPQRPAPGTDLGTDLSASLGFAGNALLRSPLAFLGAGALYMVVLVVVVLGAFGAALLFAIAVVVWWLAPGRDARRTRSRPHRARSSARTAAPPSASRATPCCAARWPSSVRGRSTWSS